MAYATVRAATAPELAYLRTPGQYSRLYLAVFKPNVIYSATLASVPSTNDRVAQIAFTHVSGTLADVRKDMTLYVGTTAGAYDLGVARIRKTPIAGTFYIGEESDIKWNNGGTIYLTVVDEFDLWARHINTVSDTDFRMDYDVTYTNQNTVFDPVPIMGGHRVVKLVGATVGTFWDFSNSYVIGSSISSYSTSCPTAAGITNGSTSTPTIQFNAAGWHPVYLTVTAANGKTYTGVRYVYVYSTASMPSTVFQLGDCAVDYESGGWTFDVTVQSGILLADVPERAMCILFAEDFYGNDQVSVGQLAGCENIICVGKIGEERININPEQSEITLTVYGMHYWLNQTNAFPTGVIAKDATPSNWAEMTNPTVQKVLYLLLHWGSTATTIMDVYLPNDTKLATELVAPSSNLWAQINELAFATIQARPGIDRFGRMFIEVEPQLVPVASRTYATVMTLTKADWYEGVNVERVVVTSTGRIDLSGIVATSAENGDAFFSLSNGHVFKHYGGVEVIDRLLLSTQTLSNQMAGLFMGWRNNPYPNNEFQLSANNRMIDCFPRQRITWSISTGDSPRGFSVNASFIPRRVAFKWDMKVGWLETELTLEKESVEEISVNGDIPGETGSISLPPTPPPAPPVPFPPIIIPGEVPSNATMKCIVRHTSIGLVFCENFNEDVGANTEWRTINSGLTTTQSQEINYLERLPSGGILVAKRGGLGAFIAYAAAPGHPFTILENQASIFAKFPAIGSPIFETVNGIGYDIRTGTIAYVIGVDNNFGGQGRKFYIGTPGNFTAGLDVTANMTTNSRGSLTFGDGEWRLGITTDNSDSKLLVLDAGVSSIVRNVVVGNSGMSRLFHLHTFDSDTIFQTKTISSVKGLIRVTGNGANAGDFTTGLGTEVNDDIDWWDNHIASDPMGTYMMLSWNASGRRGRSTDGGATIVSNTGLPFEGDYAYDYIGGAALTSHWAASAGRIYYSKDGGQTWSDQSGNFHQIAPTGASQLIEAWF